MINFLKGTFDAAWCSTRPTACAVKIGRYAAYEGPKYAIECTGSTVFWAGKQLLILSNELFPGVGLYERTAEYYRGILPKIHEATQNATNWIAPNAEELARLNGKVDSTIIPEPFSIVDLIGPSLLLGFSSKKVTENAYSALGHLFWLITGKRTSTTDYTTQAYTADQLIKVEAAQTKHYTAISLIKNALVESTFATLWAGTAYLAHQEIVSVLIANGNDPERACMIANAILTIGVTAPTILTIAKHIFMGDSKLTQSSKMPKIINNTSTQIDLDEALRIINQAKQEEQQAG